MTRHLCSLLVVIAALAMAYVAGMQTSAKELDRARADAVNLARQLNDCPI